jgi:uracil-DNA glycosylase family protein
MGADAMVLEKEKSEALDSVRGEARGCTRCHLYRNATQTVFGEGGSEARVVFVGEQPGDQEDIEGRPFVGPAGKLFDRVLEEVGIDRRKTYVTNAVKHFKWEPRGKRRIHKKPSELEINACHQWLEREIEAITVQKTTDEWIAIADAAGASLDLVKRVQQLVGGELRLKRRHLIQIRPLWDGPERFRLLDRRNSSQA